MKNYLFLLLLIAFYSRAFAQISTDEPVRIHVLYKGTIDYNLKTTLNANNPIELLAFSYTLIETNTPELTLLRGKDQITTLSFEKGKDYYFRISPVEPLSFRGIDVDEITPNAFKLELYANRRINTEPKHAKIWVKADSE